MASLPPEVAEAVLGDLTERLDAEAGNSRLRRAWLAWRLGIPSLLACRPFLFVSDGGSLMRVFAHELTYAARRLAGAPGFTVVALLSLALGIGANTAILGLVDVLLFKPLPYVEPGRLVFTQGWDVQRQRLRFTLPLADILGARSVPSFEATAAYQYWSANVSGLDTPVRAQAYRVSANTFQMLGVPPALGRTLQEVDGPGPAPVAVVSDGFWRRHLGGDPAAIGRVIRLDDEPYTIVGVMPRQFEFPIFNFKGELWVPFDTSAVTARDRIGGQSAVGLARLAPAVTLPIAQQDADAFMRAQALRYPDANTGLGVRLVQMQELGAAEIRPALYALIGAVVFVLLLACANLANLLLARGIARTRELAVRTALGASRLRLLATLMADSVLLSVGGAGLGVLLAWWLLFLTRSALPEAVLTTVPNILELGIAPVALAWTVGATVVTTLICGLLPALPLLRADLHEPLKRAGRGSGQAHLPLRAMLVCGQVALSLTLIVGAGLMIRSFEALSHASPGFDDRDVLTMSVSLPQSKYASEIAQRGFVQGLLAGVTRIPGVTAAAAVNVLPFSTYNESGAYNIDGQPAARRGQARRAALRFATPDYFQTLRVPLVAGRAFSSADRDSAPRVAIVNQALARQAFGAASPLGARVQFGAEPDAQRWATIVGVVGNVRHDSLTEAHEPEVYFPFAQAPVPRAMLAVRTAGDPLQFVAPVRAAVIAIDRDQPVFHVATLSQLVANARLPLRLAATLLAVFGGLALLLAGLGIYGVIAWLARHDAHELGVRAALGARPGQLAWTIARRGAWMVAGGVLIGTAGAAAGARLLAGLLVDTAPGDPATFAGSVALLVVVAAVACAIPARRAMRANPMDVIRAE